MNTFTPGPWTAQNHYVVTDRHERLEVIAVVGGRETLNFACDPADLENAANTLLLAAAPEMFAACKEALCAITEAVTRRKGCALASEQVAIEMLQNALIKAVEV